MVLCIYICVYIIWLFDVYIGRKKALDFLELKDGFEVLCGYGELNLYLL